MAFQVIKLFMSQIKKKKEEVAVKEILNLLCPPRPPHCCYPLRACKAKPLAVDSSRRDILKFNTAGIERVLTMQLVSLHH